MAKPLLAVNLRRILLRLLPLLEIKLAGQQLRISNHLDMIGDTLWAINSVILDANLRAAKEPELQKWLIDVTAAVVEVENILEVIQDSFQPRKEQKQEVTTSAILSNHGSISRTRHAILVDLQQTARRLNCLVSRMIAFGLQIDTIDSMNPNQAEYYSILQQEVLGREDDIKRILQIIFQPQGLPQWLNRRDSFPFFTAITGEPGIGKSILARMVYHHPDVCKAFNHRIWVDVLNSTFLSFDHGHIGRECVRHLTGRISSDIIDIWKFLVRSIAQTGFLLILDGFYNITKENEDKLMELKVMINSYIGYGVGNKVILTCHSTMESGRMKYVDCEYKLDTISRDALTELFRRYAIPRTLFGQAKYNSLFTRNSDMQSLADELYDKELYRIPFEAKKLGSILRHTTLISYHGFQKAYHKYSKHTTAHYATHEFTQTILYTLLFQPLPLIFHNHRFDMLIAEGTFNYSSSSQQQFQGDVVSWINQIHATKQAFDALLFYIKKSIYHFRKRDVQEFRIPQQCRYVCILVDSNTSKILTNLEPKIANNLRMLMLYKAKDETYLPLESDQEASSIKIPESLFKNLIILSFIDTRIQQLPNTVSMLLRLRYLNISEREMEELPESICDLYNLCVLSLFHCKKLLKLPEQIHKFTKLQILRLAYCTRLQKLPKAITSLVNLQELDVEACHWLTELPEDVIHLERLMSLNMIGCASLTQIPIGIFKVANLEALSGYIIDSEDYRIKLICEALQSRTDFKQLHLRHLERMKHLCEILVSHLSENKYLESLLLHWESWNKEHFTYFRKDLIFGTDFSCLKSLEIISIPDMPFLSIFKPGFYFRSLVEMRLVNLKSCENLRLECISPSLAILELSGMDSLTHVGSIICTDEQTLPSLVRLTLSEMSNLSYWHLRCPSLQQVTVMHCPRLTGLYGTKLENKLSILLRSEQLLGRYSSSFWSTLKNIKEMEIVGCHEMRQLPQDIEKCKHLQTLSIIRCSKLLILPDWLQQIPSLGQIFLAGCRTISYIPEKLKHRLEDRIIIRGCPKLRR